MLLKVPDQQSCSSQKLTVIQIKKVRSLIDEGITKCHEEVDRVEQLRNAKLFEVGNLLHDAVPVSNDEVRFAASGNLTNNIRTPHGGTEIPRGGSKSHIFPRGGGVNRATEFS